jgi:translation initiation factor IF-2
MPASTVAVKKEETLLKKTRPVSKPIQPPAGIMPSPSAAPVVERSKPPVFPEKSPLIPKPVVHPPKPLPPKPPAPPAKPVVSPPPLPRPAPLPPEPQPSKEIELKLPITLKDLAIRLQEKPSGLIKVLMDMRVMANINQTLNEELVRSICKKYNYLVRPAPDIEEQILGMHEAPDAKELLLPRPPIVTFMGHVDHGKTSLLDAIRQTKVVDSEHGGITQHIGAYRVKLKNGEITFLDTPGHEAFTAMRARGAGITDIVVLVVAADDGVMPQTREAIDHARAAGVTIVVAMNKIDKPQADAEKVKKQLAELDLMAEDWGGKTIVVPVSAKTGEGIDSLLDMILLEAQLLELRANPKRLAKGVVVEARLSKGKGPVATLLVQNGTLHLNEYIIVGKYAGKVRAMFNAWGQGVTEAPPAFPVEVLGLSGVPLAGEQFFVLEDEKLARQIIEKRQEHQRQLATQSPKRISLEDLHAQIQEGKLRELKLIIKSDVQGSLEAIKDTLNKLNISEIRIEFIHEGVGGINSSDVILAVASNALILGFNVTADEPAKELIAKEGVDVRTYNIIYELANDIKAAIEGMLEPKLKKVFLGRIEIRKVFKLSRWGTVAGCFVTKGRVTRQAPVGLIRNGEVIFEGSLSSLKRFKDDVREVGEGFECGITLQGFDSFQEGDIIEAYEIEKIARKL